MMVDQFTEQMSHMPMPLRSSLKTIAALAAVAAGLQAPAALAEDDRDIPIRGYAAVAGTDGGARYSDCEAHNERTLRRCLVGGNSYVRFTSDVDIEIRRPIILDAASNNLTIDGRGHSVTFRVSEGTHHHIFLLKRAFDNLVMINVRLVGNFEKKGSVGNGIGLFELDGNPKDDRPITRIALIDTTFKADPDGAPQPWCGNRNITFEGILIMDSYHPFGHGCNAVITDPERGRARNGITTFRSVLARNGERQPQLREGVYNYDFIRNIVYDWRDYDPRPNEVAGYGMKLRDSAIDNLNIVGNAFLPGSWRESWACVVGTKPGPDKGGKGMSPREVGLMEREIYFATDDDPMPNIGGDDCANFAFKRDTPNPRPYELPDMSLLEVLDSVGAKPRTEDEQALLDEIRERILAETAGTSGEALAR